MRRAKQLAGLFGHRTAVIGTVDELDVLTERQAFSKRRRFYLHELIVAYPEVDEALLPGGSWPRSGLAFRWSVSWIANILVRHPAAVSANVAADQSNNPIRVIPDRVLSGVLLFASGILNDLDASRPELSRLHEPPLWPPCSARRYPSGAGKAIGEASVICLEGGTV